MSDKHVVINGRRVQSSGTIIGNVNDLIEIYPFDQTPSYCVKINIVSLGMNEEGSVKSSIERANTVAIEIRQPWAFPVESTVTDSVVASDDNGHYYMSSYLKLIGSPDKYSYFFQYIIAYGPK